MTMQFEKMRDPGKLSERVRGRLEEAILEGKLRVNEQLPTEADLCQSFGVSRTVIREALQRLEAQGLVQSRVGSGSYVAAYSLDHLKMALKRFATLNAGRETFLHMLDLRVVIEVEAVARLTQRRDAAVVARLGELLADMGRSVKNMETYARQDIAFHAAIVEAAGNPFFVAILESLRNVQQAFAAETYVGNDVVPRVHKDHQAVYEAIAAGDPALARQRMQAHIEFSRDHYLQLLEKRQKQAK